jgi:hypothetical protein
MQLLISLPAAAHLSADLVGEAMQAVLHCHKHHASASCLAKIFKLPAATQHSSQQVAAALKAAVQGSGGVTFIRLLCKLPAAAQLSSDLVAELLHAATASCTPACEVLLCKLPASQQLSGHQVVKVLDAAVQRGDAGCVKQLCTLPTAKQLSSEALSGLLQAAQQVGSKKRSKCVAPLRGLLAAAEKAR